MNTPELGFGFKSIGRGLKKVGKATVKYTVVAPTKFAVKSNIALAKLSMKLALLPLIYLRKAVVTLGRTLCKAPPILLQQVATANGIDPAFVPAFCKAVEINSWSLGAIKRYLPTALKLALKLGASGAFPPIVPALVVVKRIPGVGKFAGAELGSYRSDLSNSTIRRGMKALEMYGLAEHLGMMSAADAIGVGLNGPDDIEAMRGHFEAAVEMSGGLNPAYAELLLYALVGGAVGVGAALIESK